MFLTWLDRRGNRKNAAKSRGRERHKRGTRFRCRPVVEQLEDRLVPTIVFNPHFGPENTVDNGGFKLNSPPIDLIFWGSTWETTDEPLATQITNATQSLLSSSYLSGLDQYGSNGQAVFGVSPVFDTSGPARGGSFTDDQFKTEIQNLIDGNALPEPDDTANLPIYVVVTLPNVKDSDEPNDFGFHTMDNDTDIGDVDDLPEAWVGAAFAPASNPFPIDTYTTALSHEIAEAMTDPQAGDGGTGITSVQPGFPFPTTGSEIGDWEPGNNYTYRLGGPGGVAAQAYWSVSANNGGGAFIVPDVTSQNFFLDPNWNSSNQFQGTYALTIQGDQQASFASSNDVVTLGETAAGGVSVTLNGETVQFDPGTISSITVKPFGGNNIVNVEDTLPGVPVTINLSGDHDLVNISPIAKNLDNIKADVTINDQSSGFAGVSVDDQNNSNPTTWSTTVSGSLTRSGAATIAYGPIDGLVINGGNGDNLYSFPFNPLAVSTTVNTGNGNDDVEVDATSGTLAVNAGTGQNLVRLCADNNLFNLIKGDVTVNGNATSTTLTVNDKAFATDATWILTATKFSRSGNAASVTYNQLTQVVVGGGNGNNKYLVQGTAAGTSVGILTGTGGDAVNVGSASNALDAIQGPVSIIGQGADTLNYFDQGTTVPPDQILNYSISANQLGRDGTATSAIPASRR
jgi:hypothetical protein